MGSLYRVIRWLVTVAVIVLALVGLLILARIIFLFFGQLQTVPGYDLVISLTNPFVFSREGGDIKTGYDGTFDLGAMLSLLLIIVIESFLSIVRAVFGRTARRSE